MEKAWLRCNKLAKDFVILVFKLLEPPAKAFQHFPFYVFLSLPSLGLRIRLFSLLPLCDLTYLGLFSFKAQFWRVNFLFKNEFCNVMSYTLIFTDRQQQCWGTSGHSLANIIRRQCTKEVTQTTVIPQVCLSISYMIVAFMSEEYNHSNNCWEADLSSTHISDEPLRVWPFRWDSEQYFSDYYAIPGDNTMSWQYTVAES